MLCFFYIACDVSITLAEQTSTINKKSDLAFTIQYEPKFEFQLNALVLLVLSELLEQGNLIIKKNMGNVSEAIKIQPILNRLISHPEEKIGLEEAARISCMSYSNFCRVFKQQIGVNYIDYCNIMRVRRAEELLIETDLSITQISDMLNFGTINYFNRLFKKYNGSTPYQYRNAMCK